MVRPVADLGYGPRPAGGRIRHAAVRTTVTPYGSSTRSLPSTVPSSTDSHPANGVSCHAVAVSAWLITNVYDSPRDGYRRVTTSTGSGETMPVTPARRTTSPTTASMPASSSTAPAKYAVPAPKSFTVTAGVPR